MCRKSIKITFKIAEEKEAETYIVRAKMGKQGA